MKQKIGRLALVLVSCTTSMFIIAEKVTVKVINDIGITTPVTVTFAQGDRETTKKIYRSAEFECVTDATNETKDNVNITATTKATENAATENEVTASCTSLASKQIRITQKDSGGSHPLLNIKPYDVQKKLVMPKKQKIRAYKTGSQDQKTPWTIIIFDRNGTKIAESTFKENTDYKVRNLYLQLNQNTVADNDPRARYNSNTISVYTSKMYLPEILPITSQSFKDNTSLDGSSIQITPDSIDIVDKNKDSLLKPGVAIQRQSLQPMLTKPADPEHGLPKKQQVKSLKLDPDKKYTVQITQADGKTEISKALFQKDTTKLYVRLNKKEETADALKPYNSNLVRVLDNSEGRVELGSFRIDAGDIKQGDTLIFQSTKAVINNKSLQQSKEYTYTK